MVEKQGKEMKIKEVVTFIKATHAEDLKLAASMGGAEIHTLYITRGFAPPAEEPVGYLVVPLGGDLS